MVDNIFTLIISNQYTSFFCILLSYYIYIFGMVKATREHETHRLNLPSCLDMRNFTWKRRSKWKTKFWRRKITKINKGVRSFSLYLCACCLSVSVSFPDSEEEVKLYELYSLFFSLLVVFFLSYPDPKAWLGAIVLLLRFFVYFNAFRVWLEAHSWIWDKFCKF